MSKSVVKAVLNLEIDISNHFDVNEALEAIKDIVEKGTEVGTCYGNVQLPSSSMTVGYKPKGR